MGLSAGSKSFFAGVSAAFAVAVLLVAATTASAAVPSSASLVAAAAAPPCTSGTQVTTASGPVCGVTSDGVTSYLGIPYAAPPVGDRRWRPPAPAAPWSDTLSATMPGPVCTGPDSNTGAVSGSEDCLTLNVQVPADAGGGSARLPVMVEIHGGGFLAPIGPASGAHLVSAGHVVYVAMNYRLGILGFMANRALGPHSGDYGLQDQQASLRWVRRNIAAFGGDPGNVTIFGQSAGGASVCANVASPTARGLFERGIPESGFYNAAIGPNQVWEPADCKSQIPTQRQAERAGARFATKVGCRPRDIACLRAVPADTLVAAGGKVDDPTAGGTSATIAPTINGTTLPMSPARAFRTGHFNRVGLMNGVDRDEINGGASLHAPLANTAADFFRLVRRQYGPLAPRVFRHYPLDRFPSPFIAYRTVVADSDSVCPAIATDRVLSRRIPVYAWQNDDASMPPDFYPSFLDPTKPWGAYHIAADPFLFPNPSITLSPDQAALAQQFTDEAVGYSRHGDPNAPGTPRWTLFDRRGPHGHDLMRLVPAGDSVLEPASVIREQHNCGFWDAVTPARPSA
jgi:para-nitrobenzyl esterase